MRVKKTLVVGLASFAIALGGITGCSTAPDEQTQEVIELIDEIGKVSDDSGDAIHKALNAYSELDDSQKERVDNYKNLTKAEDDWNQLAADKASEAIAAIGDVTLEKEDAIKQAKIKYDTLSSDQKKLVEGADALNKAEKKLEELKKQFSVGGNVTTDKWNITLTSAYVSKTLQSSEARNYWEAQDGVAFLILEFDVTALTSDHLPVDGDAITDLVAKYGSDKYADWTYQYTTGEIWLYFHNTYLDANIPAHAYVYTYVPDTAIDNGSLTVDMKIAGEEKTLTIR